MSSKKSLSRTIRYVIGLTLVCMLPRDHYSSDQIPAPRQQHPVALVGGTVHTLTGAAIENGTVLFVDGKITAIGTDVTLPSETERIEVADKHIFPGLIAANTKLGLVEINSVRATRDIAEVGEIKPNIRTEVSINPDSELIPVTRANGITLAHTIPSGGLISGTSAVIMLDGWTWESMTLKAPAGLYLNWPFMGVRRSPFVRQSEQEQLKRRDQNIAKIEAAFDDARAYLNAKQAEEKKDIPYHDTDLRWEAMIPVLNKEVPVLIHTHGVRQIQAALDWALDQDLKIILMAGQDSRLVIDLLKEHDIPVIYEGTLSTPSRRWEPYDTPFTAPRQLYEAGVAFCISGSGNAFETPHERNLPYHAAMAAAYGLPKDEALKSITLYPAQILGIDDQVGSIEIGKDATLIVTDGHPLEITTTVEQEFIQGRKIDLSSRHTQLYDKYKTKYRRIETRKMTSKTSGL